jgi:filamentous hemagglutinin family protein
MQKFTIYNASTGKIVVTNLSEQQAENVAGALRVYGQINVSVAAPSDVKGDSVHTSRVRLDEI